MSEITSSPPVQQVANNGSTHALVRIGLMLLFVVLTVGMVMAWFAKFDGDRYVRAIRDATDYAFQPATRLDHPVVPPGDYGIGATFTPVEGGTVVYVPGVPRQVCLGVTTAAPSHVVGLALVVGKYMPAPTAKTMPAFADVGSPSLARGCDADAVGMAMLVRGDRS